MIFVFEVISHLLRSHIIDSLIEMFGVDEVHSLIDQHVSIVNLVPSQSFIEIASLLSFHRTSKGFVIHLIGVKL